jgi:hypothetical protein
MAVGPMRCQGKGMSKDDREARLAAALRENLRKRKAASVRPCGSTLGRDPLEPLDRGDEPLR